MLGYVDILQVGLIGPELIHEAMDKVYLIKLKVDKSLMSMLKEEILSSILITGFN